MESQESFVIVLECNRKLVLKTVEALIASGYSVQVSNGVSKVREKHNDGFGFTHEFYTEYTLFCSKLS